MIQVGFSLRMNSRETISSEVYGEVDGHARKIPDVTVRTGQLIEQCGLAAVLVARQCKGEHGALRHRILVRLDVVFALLAETRVVRNHRRLLAASSALPVLRAFLAVRTLQGLDRDVCRIASSKRQLISAHGDLQRVSHRRKLF